MAQEFTPPATVNVKQLNDTIANLTKQISDLKNSQTPPQKPQSLTESVTPQPDFDYRTKLVEMIKNSGDGGNFSWMGSKDSRESERKYFEAIGAASAGSAVPEIWARDVFRCCPYPASAFLDAPFIKWHDDIKGKLGEICA